MAVDKLVDSSQLDSDLEDIADAIRAKGGTSASLAFPSGFVSAIGNIPTGGGGGGGVIIEDTTDAAGGTVRTITGVTISGTKTINQNGTGIDVTSYEAVDVDVGISIVDEANATGTTAVVTGGGSGGGGGGATQHSIYFEFSDSTDTTIPVYYDDSLIGTMITAYTPTTYGQKTVTLAQLDGVTWYNPADIPLNTQLVDFTAIVNGYYISGEDGTEHSNQGACCTDFTLIDPTMTFTFVGYQWFDLAFYDSTKTFISGGMQYSYMDTASGDYAQGTLNPSRIPSNAVYVRLSSYPTNPNSSQISLIRTA